MADDYKRIEWKFEAALVDPKGEASDKVEIKDQKIPVSFWGEGGPKEVTVPRNTDNPVTVPLLAGEVGFLLIRSTYYASPDADDDEKVRYSVDDDKNPDKCPWVDLDGPQLLFNGATQWFRDVNSNVNANYLHIKNGTDQDIEVQVLAARVGKEPS